MHIESIVFEEIKLITPQIYNDERGFFVETFNKRRYEECGIPGDFPQDNLSYSKQGTIRGMHFQIGSGQAKLVQVIKGTIWDVVVDIRSESKTFGKWAGVFLDDKKRAQLYIPVGFAHGFCAISEEALVSYKVSREYNASLEKGFYYNDPFVNISWPVSDPIVSIKDQKAPSLLEIKGLICCG